MTGRRGPAPRRARSAALLALAAAACARPAPPLPGLAAVTPRGHSEAVVADDGSLLPLVVGRGERFGICLETAPAVDTSLWRAVLWLPGERAGSAAPAHLAARMGSTLCFERPLPAGTAGDLELCAEILDAYDGSAFELPCQRLRALPDDTPRTALVEEMQLLLARRPPPPAAELARELDRLAARARGAGFPFLGLRFELVAVHYLRRDGPPSSVAEVRRRLAAPPPWLERPEAVSWAAQWAQSRAALELADGRLRPAWEHLRTADEAYLRLAHPNRFTVVMQRAEILGRVGAVREAALRLRAALADCDRAPCAAELIAPVRGTLAWLVMLDPLATAGELRSAEEMVTSALADIDPAGDPLEHANQLVNLGYLRLRRGSDPDEPLARVDRLLAPLPAGARRAQLDHWRWLVAAEGRLRDGAPAAALEICRRLAGEVATLRLEAWALSCVGRARRDVGDLEGAAEALERALLLHEHASPAVTGQSIALGPGRRAEDFYAAARLAVERGRAGQAWDLLARLDQLNVDEEGLGRCRESTEAVMPIAVRARREDLLGQLTALEVPASGARREQREPIRRELLAELQELDRGLADCPPPVAADGDRGLDFRAVALDDEILLLRQDGDGTVRLERRTRMPRAELVEMVTAVQEAMAGDSLDDRAWRQALAPAGAALAPDPGDSPGVTTSYSLHGVLQGLPLAALPLPAGAGAAWLGDLGVISLRPAGAVAAASAASGQLFVVDPRGNLPSGRRLAAFYRELFPSAAVQVGEQATRAAVRAALPAARRLHFDAHGVYDPAFPELSRLLLADAAVDLAEIATWEATFELANLSGCETGRWPATADGGHYGLGGQLCRRGTAWVVASRAPLPDRAAAPFNRAFYSRLAAGEAVPRAYGAALAELRRQAPASRWGALLLLEAEDAAGTAGETEPPRPHPPGSERDRGAMP